MVANRDIQPARVERTGLAVLDAGELVVSEEGSKALLSVLEGDGTLVLEFPVEVEVRIVDPWDAEQHADHTLNRLLNALEGLA
jgi:hypothetical protein